METKTYGCNKECKIKCVLLHLIQWWFCFAFYINENFTHSENTQGHTHGQCSSCPMTTGADPSTPATLSRISLSLSLSCGTSASNFWSIWDQRWEHSALSVSSTNGINAVIKCSGGGGSHSDCVITVPPTLTSLFRFCQLIGRPAGLLINPLLRKHQLALICICKSSCKTQPQL